MSDRDEVIVLGTEMKCFVPSCNYQVNARVDIAAGRADGTRLMVAQVWSCTGHEPLIDEVWRETVPVVDITYSGDVV